MIAASWTVVRRRITSFRLKTILYWKFQVRPLAKARRAARGLRHVSGPSAGQVSASVVVVAPYYGTQAFLAAFLRHYRGLGVQHFVLLDLSDARALADLMREERDVSVWQPAASRPVRDALHWLNHLRGAYCEGRWCLSVEPTDLLVFYRSETRHIRDFTELLEMENRHHCYAIVIELYGDRKASALDAATGDPAATLPYFDKVGYSYREVGRFGSVVAQGGIQRRTLFADDPRRTPPLNRVPLVKWRKNAVYLAGTRVLMPRRMNTAHAKWHVSPTACLLRYALLEDGSALSIASSAEEAALLRDGQSSSYPGLLLLRDHPLKHNGSGRLRTTQDLVDAGLLSPGQWF